MKCKECDCPILRNGRQRKNPDDYRHARGCPLGDAPCTGARILDSDEIVDCENRAEWIVGTTPACSGCVATFLDDESPTTVSPIDALAVVAPLYTITPPAIRRVAEGFAKGIANMIAAKVPRGPNGGELVVNQSSIAAKIEAAIISESKRTVVDVEGFLAGARHRTDAKGNQMTEPTMTPSELSALKEALEGITPGPWVADPIRFGIFAPGYSMRPLIEGQADKSEGVK